MLPDRPETLDSINNLAEVYNARGRYREAEALYRESLEAKRRVLGPEHLAALQTAQNLADVYAAEGRHEEAEKLSRETVAISRRVLGADHSLTLVMMGSLARDYADEHRYPEAERLASEVLETSRRVLGADHPSTLAALSRLADVDNAQGLFARAAPLAQEARAGYERIGSKTGPGLGNARAALGRALTGLKRYSEAEAEFLGAEGLLSAGKGRDYKQCLESVVEMYRAWDRSEPDKGHAAQAETWKAKLDSPQ